MDGESASVLALKFIRQNPDLVKESLIRRGLDPHMIDELLTLDKERRYFLSQVEDLRHQRNIASQEIGLLKKEGKDTAEKQQAVRELSLEIKTIDEELKKNQARLEELLLFIPNLLHSSVPTGNDVKDNKVVRQVGEKRCFDFPPRLHWDIGETLGILDLEKASKLSGSMFALYKGAGAKLQRALISWMIDLHVEKHNYVEVYPPFIVKRECMIGTGQLPKFFEEVYWCSDDDLFLIPTAEVPVTNLHRDEILKAEELPMSYVAYTPCFRREAGAAGQDTRGLQRMHQFDKVELVKFTLPEKSYEEHEKLLQDAEEVLRCLEIPYRVCLLCSGDMGFSAAKCYDIEAWAPGLNKWLEVASCSNFEDFQSRRANIRFRRNPQAKLEFVHTLNSSGLALPRTFIAILENYQQADGSVVIPEVLRDYMGGLKVLAP